MRTNMPGDAFACLPEWVMRASAKEDAIRYLAASDLLPAVRRRLWRSWCFATQSRCRREDVARVAPPQRTRERQGSLLP